jgi:hypothetical protein
LVIIFTITTTNTAATSTATSTNTTSNTSSPVIELSPQPIYQGYSRTVSQAPINETHISATDSGNGTLTLPETGERVNVTTNGSGLFSLTTGAGQGEVTIRTQGGEETATVTFYEIDRHPDITTGEGKGIVIAVINTNTTSGMLAPLNGMILVGINEFQTSTAEGRFTLWEWKS